MMYYNTMIVLAGTGLLGANAGLVGTFAVLRRRALTGDALSHAALPGLCLAFLVVGARNLPAMLLGALATGLLGIGCISMLRHTSRVKEDAAIGLVLSVFFGAGIVLSRMIQNRTTAGSKAGLDSYIFGKTAGMLAQDVLLIGGVSLASLVIVLLAYKEFKSVVFDPEFARVQGMPVLLLDFLLMGLIAVTVVIGLPAVGVVLVSALLILPGAAARFWTEDLRLLLVISAFIGASVGLSGTFISAQFRLLPAGPIIVLVGTSIFLASVALAPKRGVLARLLMQRRFRAAHAEHAFLRGLHDAVEPSLPLVPEWTSEEIENLRNWHGRFERLLQRALRCGDLAVTDRGGIRFTARGLDRARNAARDARLRQALIEENPDLVGILADPQAGDLSEIVSSDLLAEAEQRVRAAGRLPGPTSSISGGGKS